MDCTSEKLVVRDGESKSSYYGEWRPREPLQLAQNRETLKTWDPAAARCGEGGGQRRGRRDVVFTIKQDRPRVRGTTHSVR